MEGEDVEPWQVCVYTKMTYKFGMQHKESSINRWRKPNLFLL